MISGWPTFRIMCDTPSSIVIGKQIAFGTPDTFLLNLLSYGWFSQYFSEQLMS
jgi:hypothetical protein